MESSHDKGNGSGSRTGAIASGGLGATFRRVCENATRNGQIGRTRLARAGWERALRLARRMRCARSTRLALDVLSGRNLPSVLPLPATPEMARPARRRTGTTLVIQAGVHTHSLSPRVAHGLLPFVAPDLIVDQFRDEVRSGARVLSMGGWDLPMRILAILVKNRGVRVTSQQIFEHAWERPARTRFDLRALYFHIWRLRQRIAPLFGDREVILLVDGGYRIDPALKVALVTAPEPGDRPASEDTALAAISQRGSVDNRTFCKLTRLSRSAAYRTLQRLVERGALQRIGHGKSTRYQVLRGAA